MQDNFPELTGDDAMDNATRAQRFDMLLTKFEEMMGEQPDPVHDELHASFVVADMLHWCRQNKHNLNRIRELAQLHFNAEILEASE